MRLPRHALDQPSSSRTSSVPASNSSSNSKAGNLPPSGAGRSDSKEARLKRAPSSRKPSASSLAASLISSLSSTTASSSAAGAAGATTLPALASRAPSSKGGSFTHSCSSAGGGSGCAVIQVASAASSRPPSSGGLLRTAGSTPVVGPAAPCNGIDQAPSSNPPAGLGGNGSGLWLEREKGDAGTEPSSSLCPTPTARSFTEGSALRSKVSAGQQLPPLGGSSSGPGSSSLEGGKSVLFKEARAKFLDPLGRPLPAADSSRTLLPAAQFLSAPGGSAASVPSEWGAGSAAAGNSTTKSRSCKSLSRVSFQLAPKVSFIHDSSEDKGGSSDSDAGPSSSSSSNVSPDLVPTASVSAAGSQPHSSHGSTLQGAPAAVQLTHARIMHGGFVGAAQDASLCCSTEQATLSANPQSLGQGGSATGDTTPRGLKGGLAAISHKVKLLALSLDPHSSEHASPNSSAAGGSTDGTSTSASGGSTSCGGAIEPSISFSPVPTPKDGTSALRALAYKHHHGFLPSPTASSAGGVRTSLSQKGGMGLGLSRAGSESVSRAGSSRLLDAVSTEGDTTAEPVTAPQGLADSVRVPLAAGAAVAGTACGDAGVPASLPLLPPGAVPLLGAAAAANPVVAVSSSSSFGAGFAASGSLGSIPGQMYAGRGQQRDAAGMDSSSAASGAPKLAGPFKLGPASLSTPMLLAVSPWLPRSMQRDQWCLADFVLQKKIHDGYASTICRAKDRVSGAVVALKLYRMHKLNDISSHQVAREVRLHIGLQHENIITLYSAWQEAGNVVLVQEFAGQGDLWSFIDNNSGRLTERMTVSLVLQPFLRGLQFLHSAGIAHRDIKPENVLFASSMVLKIADFGLAVNLREEPAVTRVGTLDYMAPEVLRCPLKRHPGDNKSREDLHYATAVDAWAVGVLAFELLTGRAPFAAAGASDASIQSAICTSSPSFPSRISQPAKQFISAALNKAAAARPTVLQMLQHPWIRSFQRSCSNARAEPHTSQELGGTGRLLLSPISTQPAHPVPQLQASSSADTGGSGAAPMQGQAASSSSAGSSASRTQLTSSRDESVYKAAAAAAAAVWNSDDNGLTGYASRGVAL